MDNEFLKSAAEDHHQMEMMLMQMDNFEIPMLDFTNHHQEITTTKNSNVGCTLENPNQASFMNLHPGATSNISFSGREASAAAPPYLHPATSEKRSNSMAAMREMIFRIAAMQPIHIDPESVKPPKRRNVKISNDPQSVAARHRRERISERIRILQRLVPGGTKMDTASMLDEAIHYVKFLKNQVQTLERVAVNGRPAAAASAGVGFPVPMSSGSYFPVVAKGYHESSAPPSVQHFD